MALFKQEHRCVLIHSGPSDPMMNVKMSCVDNKVVWISRILSTGLTNIEQINFNNLCNKTESRKPGSECFYYDENVTSKVREDCKMKSKCTYNIEGAFYSCDTSPVPDKTIDQAFFHVLYRCISKRGKYKLKCKNFSSKILIVCTTVRKHLISGPLQLCQALPLPNACVWLGLAYECKIIQC